MTAEAWSTRAGYCGGIKCWQVIKIKNWKLFGNIKFRMPLISLDASWYWCFGFLGVLTKPKAEYIFIFSRLLLWQPKIGSISCYFCVYSWKLLLDLLWLRLQPTCVKLWITNVIFFFTREGQLKKASFLTNQGLLTWLASVFYIHVKVHLPAADVANPLLLKVHSNGNLRMFSSLLCPSSLHPTVSQIQPRCRMKCWKVTTFQHNEVLKSCWKVY